MSVNLDSTRVLKTHWEAVEEGARRAGRQPDRSQWRIARDVFVAESTRKARREALQGVLRRDFEQYFQRLTSRMKMLGLYKEDPDMPDSEVTAEYLVDNIWLVGSPEDVAEKLRKLYHDVGGFGVLLAMGHEWQPRQAWQDSMRLLRQEVMPRLADLR